MATQTHQPPREPGKRWPEGLDLRRALAAAVLVSGGALTWLALYDGPAARDPTSMSLRQSIMRDRVLSRTLPRPEVAFIGSSRAAYGVIPGLVEDALGLGRGSVVNLSYPGLDGLETVEFLENEPAFGAGFGVCVLFVDHSFLRERIPTTQGISAVVGGYLETWFPWVTVVRSKAAWMARNWLIERQLSPRLALVWEMEDRGRWFDSTNPDPAPMRGEVYPFEAVADSYYKGWRPDREVLRRYRSLAIEFGRCGRVAVVHLPYSDGLDEEIGRRYAPLRDAMRDYILSLEPSIPVVYYASARDAGLDDGDYFDAVHLTAAGAAKFTRRLVHDLRGKNVIAIR